MTSYTDDNGKKWYLYSIHLCDYGETLDLAHEKQWSAFEFDIIAQKRTKFLKDAREEYENARRSVPQRLVTEELENLPQEERNTILGVQFDNDRKLQTLNWEYVKKIKPVQDYRKFLESEGFVELDTTYFKI